MRTPRHQTEYNSFLVACEMEAEQFNSEFIIALLKLVFSNTPRGDKISDLCVKWSKANEGKKYRFTNPIIHEIEKLIQEEQMISDAPQEGV